MATTSATRSPADIAATRSLLFNILLRLIALAVALSARIGGSAPRLAMLRVVVGGAAGLAIAYAVGHLFGAAIG